MSNSITAIAAAALAIGISTYGIEAYKDAQEVANQLGSVEINTIKKAYGISDLVYNCVEEAFKKENKNNVDDLVAFIELEAQTAGTENETQLAAEIKACVYQDPFGWHGTENEWAIELLDTESWE